MRQSLTRISRSCAAQIASISIWARLLVPSSTLSHPIESGIQSLSASADKGKVSFALSIIAATLSFVAFMITGTMPRAPPYHFLSLIHI